MAARGVTRSVLALTCLLAACSSGSDGADPTTTTLAPTSSTTTTTTAPERPASTTTTAFDPTSVKGEVEAAYLKSWDIYAEAVYDLILDEEALAEVYAGESLTNLMSEIEARIDEGRAALVRVDHDYEIAVSGPTAANVVDAFVNHQVLIDPVTRAPIEEDPNERLLVNFKLELIDGSWRVTLVQKVTS